jgi:hypothetical protein
MVVEEKGNGWLSQPFICGALFTPRFRLFSGPVASAPALMHRFALAPEERVLECASGSAQWIHPDVDDSAAVQRTVYHMFKAAWCYIL